MATEMPRHILRNCNIFIDRIHKLGQASEIMTPKLTVQTEDVRNAGMIKSRPIKMGVEVEDAEVKMTAIDPDTLRIFCGPIGVEKEFMAVGALVDEDGTKSQAIYYFRGFLSGFDLDNWQPGQLASHGYPIKAVYGKLEVGGRELIEWDDYEVTTDSVPNFGLREQLLV